MKEKSGLSHEPNKVINPNKQIIFLDFIRMFLCIVIALIIFGLIESHGTSLWKEPSESESEYYLISLLALLFYNKGIAAFLATFLGLLIISWRYKLIAGILLLFAVIVYVVSSLNFSNFWLFVLGIEALTFGFLGAVGAIFIWDWLNEKKKEKLSKSKTLSIVPSKNKPKTSLVLLMLSLCSVPLTYVAMLVSAFVTLGISGLFLLLIFYLPRIPIFLIIAAVFAPFVALVATCVSLWKMFLPKPQFQPAISLNLNSSPALNSMINNVCKKIKTKQPTSVILHAEPTFFVMQGKCNTFDGVARGRILALGLPLLKQLSPLETQSILAHEFAHFSGRDTLYSTIVYPVYLGINSSMQEMRAVNIEDSNISGVMTLLMLPSVFFLGLFLKYFVSIDMILSRGKELRADWIAANLYGKTVFADALTKAVGIGYHYNKYSEGIALNSKSDFFHNYSMSLRQTFSELEKYKTEALTEKESDFDSHPSLTTRLLNLPEERERINLTNETQGLREELSKEEEILSQKYTERVKKAKELYEQIFKILQEQKAEKPTEKNSWEEALEKWRNDPNDKRTWGQVKADYEKEMSAREK